jgi:hypothetical protein
VTASDPVLPNFIGRLSSAALDDAMEAGDGFATFGCGSEVAFLEAAQEYGVLMHHRDSDDRGITRLREVPQPGERALGFTNDALLPHTDRPAIPTPPRVLLLWCQSGSTEGGEATVLRGQDVADRLGELDLGALRAFSAADTAIFRTGADERIGPVFEMVDGVLQQVRLRFDPHVYFTVDAALAMPTLLRALRDTERIFQLRPGTGYAVRNDRWLHGRRAFTGNREMLRIMIGGRHPVDIDA